MANMLALPAVATAAPMAARTASPIPTGNAPMADASEAAYAPGTMSPMPKSNALAAMPAANPFAQPKGPPRNALLASAFDGFQRGFDPAGYEKRQATNKAEGMEKQKQILALIEQQRALPFEQRAAWWQQHASVIGPIINQDVSSMPVDPNQFTDQALDGYKAALSAQMGVGPAVQEPMKPMEINNRLVDPRTGKVMGDYSDPQRPLTVNNRLVDPETGEVIGDYSDPAMPKTYNTGQAIVSIDPATNKPTVLYRDPQQPTASDSFRTLSPEEVAQRGYSKGTVVQIDGRGKEYVTARPSTAQTGLPTEGERNAGMHVTVALNGLQKLVDAEGGGYNRAGWQEQLAGVIGTPFGQGEQEKLYDQAAAEFIDGYLRAMTGAAATSTEIDTYRKQWFPQFGDTPAVVKQKAAGRLNAIRGMKAKAGRAWNPSWDGIIQQLEQQVGGAASAIAPPPSAPALTPDEQAELEALRLELGQ